jgi:hypothetical protein
MSADDCVPCSVDDIPLTPGPEEQLITDHAPAPPAPFYNNWRAVSTIRAILMWQLYKGPEWEDMRGAWRPIAGYPTIQQMGTHDLYVATDPSGCPLFFVARLWRGDAGCRCEGKTLEFPADVTVYTVVSAEKRMGGAVALDYDAPATAEAARRAFAWARDRCGADVIVVGDLARHGSAPLASFWLLQTGRWWWEDVVPVVAEPWRAAPPVEELRATFRAVTWGGFLENWYTDRPSSVRERFRYFWPAAAVAAADTEPFGAVLRRIRAVEPDWTVRNGNTIYSCAYYSVKRELGPAPDPFDYICVWRRGTAAAVHLSNPVIGQFEQCMGGWDDS